MVSFEMHTLSQERAPVEERATWLSQWAQQREARMKLLFHSTQHSLSLLVLWWHPHLAGSGRAHRPHMARLILQQQLQELHVGCLLALQLTGQLAQLTLSAIGVGLRFTVYHHLGQFPTGHERGLLAIDAQEWLDRRQAPNHKAMMAQGNVAQCFSTL